jgi:uncharacterized membrane protein YedE/YeeE
MTVDFGHFTPLASLLGGVLIGLAASVFILVHGRIMGVIGILGGILRPLKGDLAWRIVFLLGLVSAPLGASLLGVQMPAASDGSIWQLALGGLLVGFGATLGSGCTSGHGVCGIARLSPRSIMATLVFMATGALTVYLTHHVSFGG